MTTYNYLSVKQVAEKYPFSYSTVRKLLFHRKQNGLDKVIRKVGGLLVFREDLFIEWVESQIE